MCGIVGIVTERYGYFNRELIWNANAERGHDGYGVMEVTGELCKYPGEDGAKSTVGLNDYSGCTLVNFRAEPTVERIASPGMEDQQPYRLGNWTIVHNGIIANDKELIAEYDLKSPTAIDSWVIVGLLDKIERELFPNDPGACFGMMLARIKGSFAIIAKHASTKHELFYATDYRPLYWHTVSGHVNYQETIVCSVKPHECFRPVPPYSYGTINKYGIYPYPDSLRPEPNNRCLVVLSGGLDSTVAAAMCIDKGYDVEFLHFQYGCRATQNEEKAVRDIAAHYRRPLRIVPLNDLFTRVIGGSRLVDPDILFADGIAGSEQAIEWVPARNTIMASIATGIAEAHGFGRIVLGVNNEESGGGYTDNVLDLYQGFNNLNHWINGYGKNIVFEWPVGSMMKRHIVAEGLRLDAPLHLTWSCYNTGNQHCGRCGPCYMRKTAFEINGANDPVFACEEIGGVAQ